MHSKWVFKHFYLRTSNQVYVLAILWVIGLLSGIILCSYSYCDFTGIFFGAVNVDPAPLALFLVCMLPVLLSAVAVSFSLFSITCLVVFAVAVFQGFSSMVVYIAVGSAAWLLRPILLFSASCSSVLMWWLLLQHKKGRRLHKSIHVVLISSSLTFVVDMFLVSPFVSDLAKVLLEGFA